MINAKFLERAKACDEGRDWFFEHFPSGEASYEETMLALIADNKMEFAYWLGNAVGHLTAKQRTRRVCELAVAVCGRAVAHLTDRQRSPRVCELAVRQDGRAVVHLKDVQRTPRVCELAVTAHRFAMAHLTDAQRTRRVRELARAYAR